MASITKTDGIWDRAREQLCRFNPFHWAVFVIVAIAVLTPLAFLILGSFSDADLPTEFRFDALTLEHYRTVWLDPDTYTVFANTPDHPMR